jgi:hypothetical protein
MNREQMETELKDAGWSALWHADNWVPPNSSNPDWAGMPIGVAYREMISQRDRVGAVDGNSKKETR